MFINQLDKFIELEFNYTNDYISKNNFDKNLKKDITFFQTYYQKIINKVDYSKIFEYINDDLNKKKIQIIVEKYILFYLLLTICLKDDEKNKLSENNDKNFIEKLFIISNEYPILDSVYIGELLEIYKSYYICLTLIILLKQKKDISDLKNEQTIEMLQLFSDIGIDNILKYFDLKNNGMHNIIVCLLFRKLYIKTDKKDIAIIEESNDNKNAEFKYIDIVEARTKEIDFASMEMLFNIEDRSNGLPDDYYNLLEEFKLISLGDIEENLSPKFAIQSNLISDDQKIGFLFHKKLLIPITDEILRYHVNAEKYSNESIGEVKGENKRVDTKLNYIINKINTVTELSSKDKKIYYQPLFYRQAIPYNDIEEMKIIKKFADIGKINSENVQSFTDLLSFRVYPYINFKNFQHYGFLHKHNYSTEALRYANFRFRKNDNYLHLKDKNMQWRIITHDNFRIDNKHNFDSAIVGIALPRYINFKPYDIRCIKLNNSINIRKYNINGFKITKHILQNIIQNNKILNKTPFWIFDTKTDTFNQDTYDEVNNVSPQIYFKKLISKIYDNIEEQTLNRILNEYEYYQPLTLYQSLQIFNIITSRYVPIPKFSDKIAQINYARYYTYLPQRLFTQDIKDITFSTSELKKLPVYKPPTKPPIVTLQINNEENNKFNILDIAVCQHIVSLEEIQRFRERDPTLFTQKINDFYKKYIIDNTNNNFICKSCSQFINIDKYVSQYGDLIKINAESRLPLEQQKRYDKFGKAIASLDKIIERMGSIFNLSDYMGNNPSSILKRRETIRLILDFLISSHDIRSKEPGVFDKEINELETISGSKYTEYFAFPVENDIFVYSSRDTDKFKRKKYNTILTHIAVLMILELSASSILYFNTDKLINITVFEKYGLNTLENLKLRINMGNDLVYLGNYTLLGYVIYYMASMMIKMKIYEIENQEIDVKKIIPPLDRLRIMHSITHLLSIIVNRRIKNSEYLYTILANNYFIKLLTVYNINTSETILKDIRYFSLKKIDNTPSKKLITNKQTYHILDGIMDHYSKFSGKISENISKLEVNSLNIFKNKVKLYLQIYPIKKVIYDTKLDQETINKMIKKNLLWFYNKDSSVIKLNIDILQLDKYSLTDLLDIKNKYIKLIQNRIDKQRIDLINKAEYQNKKLNKLKKLNEILNQELLPFDEILEKFLTKIEKYVSAHQPIYQDDYFLRTSVFIINHDFAGFPIKPYKIDKITIKYKDNITNKDVIIYKEKNTERYYDIYTLSYLGYKTDKTEYVSVMNSQYLKIQYSLMDKIKYIGTYRKYINVLPLDKQIIHQSKFRGDIIYDNTELVNQVIKKKINHEKILLEKFQRILYTIKNQKNQREKNEEENKDMSVNQEKKLINEFIPRLKNLRILNDDFVLFLQNWKNVTSSFTFTPLTNNSILKDLILDSDTINSNSHYNILIRYLLTQLINLLEFNDDKTNINLCNCIAMIFDLMWKEYNIPDNYEINKFLLLLNSTPEDNFMSTYDVDDSAVEVKIQDETKLNKLDIDKKEQIIEQTADEKEDFKEEQEALDVEGTEPEDLDLGEEATMYDRETE
jgi:hypothetical protein